MSTREPYACLIEDDLLMGEALCDRFDMENIRCDWHQRGKTALAALQRKSYDIVVSDMRLPDISGEELFLRLRQKQTDAPPFIFMTAYGSLDQAVRLLKLGAADYVVKPLNEDLLVQRMRELGEPFESASVGERALGISRVMQRLEQTLTRLAINDSSVLITGESGVGKELVARHLHELGEGGSSKPFIAVNCAAIPETLLEAEMFGFDKGAFTGATKERRGYFEQADGGTLFLDEIGDMPLAMQAKILRAIQDNSVVRIGGERPIHIKLRLVCATHEDLQQLVEANNFREDLYYRINVIHLRIPPLRERRDDILWLARRFAKEQSRKRGKDFSFTREAERALLCHPWPGNIRELKHHVERACVLSQSALINVNALFEEPPPENAATPIKGDTLIDYLDSCEKRYIEQLLVANNWKIGQTAENLGISRKNLWQKMKKHDISEGIQENDD